MEANKYEASRLVVLFNSLFQSAEQTVLVGGAKEPIYMPSSVENGLAQVVFSYDYFASALHEVAHWCLAGTERRQQLDYGYWYVECRSELEQEAFERAEVKPQALERVFSECTGYPFKPSFDCLQRPEYVADNFVAAMSAQYEQFLLRGLPSRAALFADALCSEFSVSCAPNIQRQANG
ncbi:MAG: elongation factor P hydroxylase [Pseudomonadales bacterium]